MLSRSPKGRFDPASSGLKSPGQFGGQSSGRIRTTAREGPAIGSARRFLGNRVLRSKRKCGQIAATESICTYEPKWDRSACPSQSRIESVRPRLRRLSLGPDSTRSLPGNCSLYLTLPPDFSIK
jgi:hypothetical protein